MQLQGGKKSHCEKNKVANARYSTKTEMMHQMHENILVFTSDELLSGNVAILITNGR